MGDCPNRPIPAAPAFLSLEVAKRPLAISPRRTARWIVGGDSIDGQEEPPSGNLAVVATQ
jgi:hypothetical protein